MTMDQAKMNLTSLPTDIFNKIGSYLPLTCCIQLSTTSHQLHKMVQNDDFFSQIKSQMKTMKLTESLLTTIYENDSSLECFKFCEHLYISSDIWIDCNDDDNDRNKCVLHKIVSKIDTYDNTNKDKSKDKMCNILWFRFILSNIEQLFVSTSWHCAFKHLPMSWIFDKNPWFNPNQKFPNKT